MTEHEAWKLERGDRVTVARPHPEAGKTLAVTRVINDWPDGFKICTDAGIVLDPAQATLAAPAATEGEVSE
jgi:hypothetical protein